MANYYTYGMVPDVDETVYGTSVDYAGLGFPEYADRGLPEEAPVGPSPLSLVEDEGMLPQAPPETVERYASYLPKETPSATPPPPLATPNPIPPGLEAAFLRMRGQSPEQLAAKAEATAQTKPQREVLSNLLQTGQFDKAFKYAKDEGVQNLLIDPTELKTLRGPFSNDEMKSFFAAMPKDLMGEQDERAVKFTPDKALDQSLQVASIPREGIAQGPLGDIIGYPDVQRAFEPQQLVKEPNAFDKLIKAAVYGGLAYAGATALAGAGSLGKAIVKLPETIGIKVGEALGAGSLNTLQAKMIGNAVISGGVTGARGGDLEDVLKSAALAAGFTYVSDKAIRTISEGLQRTGVTDAVQNIPGGDVTAVDPSVAADVASKVSQGLDQFTVTFSPASAAAQMATTVGALGAAQAATAATEPEVKVTAEAEKPVETPPVVTSPVDTAFEEAPEVEGKQEVKVEAPAEKPVETPPVVTSPVDTAFEEAPEVEGKQEVKVEAPAEKPVETPPVVTSPVDTAFEEAPTVDDKQEIKVEAPAEKPVETPPVVTSPVDTAFEEAPTVDDKQEIKVEAPAEKPVETPPVVTTPVDTAFEEAPTVDNKQEIKVEAPAEKPVETPPVVVTSPVDTAFEEAPTVDDKQEIKVEAEPEKPVETPPVVTGPVDTAFEEAPTVDGEQEIKVETEAEKPVEPPPVVVTPPPAKTEPPPEEKKPEEKKEEENPLKALLDKYGTLENFLKLLGALGAAGSKTPKVPVTTPTAPTGGMGGALPKYTYTRQQLSPDIDYYTYGTRPEAKFFEQGFQLEKPTQPPAPQPEGPPAGPLSSPAVLEVERPVGLASDTSDQQVYATPSSYTGPTIAEEDPERYREMIADMQSFLTVTPREGATEAELEELRNRMEPSPKAMGGLTGYSDGGSNESRYVDGPGSGRDDKIPALLSDGEYVMDAETLALLGDGSTKEGARRMDEFRANIRRHKGRALSRGQISPDAKSPDKYMGGGLA